MPTPEEIKKIAREVASKIEPKKGYGGESYWIRTATEIIEKIVEDFCIVPKSKLKENYLSLKNGIPDFKQDPKRHCGFLGGMTELELLFGTELFNEEK